MLFWLFVIVLIVSVGLFIIGRMDWDRSSHKFLYYYDEEIMTCGVISSIFSAMAVVISVVILCAQYIGIDAKVAKNLEIYNAIEYKVTSDACRDEFGLLSKEVIDEVQNWNKDVIYYQNIQDDFWVGIFYPNVFDQFEVIDYEKYNEGN